MEYRRRKAKERKERRRRVESRDDGGDGRGGAMEWIDGYGREGGGEREPKERYSRDSGREAGGYADGDVYIGPGARGNDGHERPLSPTRDRAGGEWRGGAYDTRYEQGQRDWGYNTPMEAEQGRRRERGSYHNERSGYATPRDSNHRYGMEGSVRHYHRGDGTETSAYNDQNQRQSSSRHWIRTNKELRDGRSRREAKGQRRDPPSLHREDAGQFIEDDGPDRTSQWVKHDQGQVRDGYQNEGYSHEVPRTRELGPAGRRDRGFGILKDEKECYREVWYTCYTSRWCAC